MLAISLKEMLEAGAHFGHQTRRWNPKMRPYIYGERNGIHVIDLQKTVSLFKKALEALVEIVAEGGDILFVGTKRQARDVISAEATRCNMFYINDRWMGGALTNFKTIKSSIDRLIEMEEKMKNSEYDSLTKRERLGIERHIAKLTASLGGIKHLKGIPAALVIVDPKVERIAVNEANVLGLPTIAITDTNCDPTVITYPIPANDDASRSIQYIVNKIAEICLVGLELRDERIRSRVEQDKTKKVEEKDHARPERRGRNARLGKGNEPKAYVRRGETAGGDEETATGAYSAKIPAADKDSADSQVETQAAHALESGGR